MATIATHNRPKAHRAHNIRDKRVVDKESHIDPNGVHEIWKDEKVAHAYHRLFDDAVAEYNAKQTREERKIGSYLAKIEKDGKKHPVYEMIIGVYGNEDPETNKKVLKEFVNDWSRRNPNLELIGAYYHADEEGEPHVHLDYVPVVHGCKRGLETQNALNKAFKAMGFETVHSSNTAQIQWERSENKALEDICRKYGIEVEHPDRDKLPHEETKVYKMQQEVKKIEADLSEVEGDIFKARTDQFHEKNKLRRTIREQVEAETKRDIALSEAAQAELRRDKAVSEEKQAENSKNALEGDIERLRGVKGKVEKDIGSLEKQKAAANKELDTLYLQKGDLIKQQREFDELEKKKAAIEKECAELLELPTEWEVTNAYEKMEQHFKDMKELLTAQEQNAYHSLDIKPLQASLDKAVKEKKIADSGFKGVQVSRRANEGFINLLADLIRLMLDYIRKKTSPHSIEEVKQRVDNYHNRNGR